MRRALSSALGAAILLLSSCGAGNVVLSSKSTTVPPVTSRLYSIDATHNVVLEYELNNSIASTTGTLALPSGFSPTLVATDPNGSLYVGGTVASGSAEVVVYAAGASGEAVPLRTVTLTTGKLTALAADANGKIYAAKLNTLASVEVYAAGANGAAAPTTVLNPTHFQYLNDVAVTSAGVLYVSGWNGGAFFIETYAAAASGQATATAALFAPAGSYFGGIALDSYGNLWAMEELTIVEFAPGATGTPPPLTLITLPLPTSPYTGAQYSDILRIDSNGLLYVPVTFTATGQSASAVDVFSPAQSGMATPAAIAPAAAATQTTPLNTNIALAVH